MASSTSHPQNRHHPSNRKNSNVHDVMFGGIHIITTVTDNTAVMDEWISTTCILHQLRLKKLIVGLDTENCLSYEGKPKKVAIMQICIENRCLIFQLCHCQRRGIPRSLKNFLSNRDITFVGKAIGDDVHKLSRDYSLHVERFDDIGEWAASKLTKPKYIRMSLKSLCFKFTGKKMEKPKHITISKWNSMYLAIEQVEYACIDVYASYAVGVQLDKPLEVLREILLENERAWKASKEYAEGVEKLHALYPEAGYCPEQF